MDLKKRTWAEINLDNIEHNVREMKAQLKEGTRFLGVVKANAYGHGAVQVASVLEEIGICDYLAVATSNEAFQLRENGMKLPILILGCSPLADAEAIIQNDITQAVPDMETAKAFSEAAVKLGKNAKVHLKADSGMGRIGFICHDGRDPHAVMLEIMKLPGLDVEGIFTHFSVSDTPSEQEYTDAQYKAFTNLIDELEKDSGKKFKIRHCANSGAMVSHPDKYLDMVRPGICLYGIYPGPDRGVINLKPVMELKTRIVHIKEEVEPGYSISYGRTYKAPAKRKIAVLPIGYADGLHRVLSNQLEVLVHGKRVKQVGRICMDMCMIDVTDIEDVKVGDVVTIFGQDGEAFVSVDELAEKASTISYELVCAVSPRVPRVYTRHSVTL